MAAIIKIAAVVVFPERKISVNFYLTASLLYLHTYLFILSLGLPHEIVFSR